MSKDALTRTSHKWSNQLMKRIGGGYLPKRTGAILTGAAVAAVVLGAISVS